MHIRGCPLTYTLLLIVHINTTDGRSMCSALCKPMNLRPPA